MCRRPQRRCIDQAPARRTNGARGAHFGHRDCRKQRALAVATAAAELSPGRIIKFHATRRVVGRGRVPCWSVNERPRMGIPLVPDRSVGRERNVRSLVLAGIAAARSVDSQPAHRLTIGAEMAAAFITKAATSPAAADARSRSRGRASRRRGSGRPARLKAERLVHRKSIAARHTHSCTHVGNPTILTPLTRCRYLRRDDAPIRGRGQCVEP